MHTEYGVKVQLTVMPLPSHNVVLCDLPVGQPDLPVDSTRT